MELTNIKTPKFRLSFPELLKPTAFKPDDTPKYSLTMLYDVAFLKANPEQLALFQNLQAAVKQCAEEKWGVGFTGYESPFNSGAEKAWEGYGAGVIYVKSKSKFQPGLVAQDGETIITNAADLYAGCYCRASVSMYASDFMKTKRVTFQLNNVQKWGDGEPFGGGVKADKDFGAIAGADAVEPAANSLLDGNVAATEPVVEQKPANDIDSLLA